MSKIGYIRVSATDQNTDRQEMILKELNLDKYFIEKVSGKNTDRTQLKKLMEYVREGDTVYIESISRLARSAKDLLNIVQQLQEKSVELISLKENIDTTTPQGRFVLTIFGALSELERENILQRQKEGITAAKMKGKKFGRPQIAKPKDWDNVIGLWKAKQITAAEAMRRLNLNRGTFYRRVNGYKEKTY
ncbi:MAG: recombinase family protein [Oscillospiraceae bacterium]|nr:recombinase family protein [Oscillospiraceae bacterium]